MRKIGIVVNNDKILPQVGEEFEVISTPDRVDPYKMKVNLSGIDHYVVNVEDIVKDTPEIEIGEALFEDVEAAGGFKKNTVTGVVKDILEKTNDIGRQYYVVVLECVATPNVTTTSNKSKNASTIVEIKFRGSLAAYPKKAELVDAINNKKPLTEEFSVAKKGDSLELYYGNDPVGAPSEALPVDVKNRLKIFDESNRIPVEYSSYVAGLVYVNLDTNNLELDLSNEFVAEKAYAQSVGVTEDEFDTYIKLMTEVYALPPKLVKMVINSWKPINNDYLERYISLDRIATTDKKGNLHPLYIDQWDNVRRCVSYLISGKENLCLKGEASVGKNILIETLAGLFRKPLLRESLSGGSDLSTLLGDRTVNNDNSLGFEPSQLVKAAENGCWIVLDEINTVSTEFLTVLHSLLESDIRAINVPFYKYVKASPDFRCIATMNPVDSGEYVGTKELNSATASRFKTVDIKTNVGFEQVLKNNCPEADDKEIKSVARVYAAIKKIYDVHQSDLSSAFLAIRRYTSILNDDVANEFVSLKERCIDSLVEACPNDRVQSELVLQTINDIIA